MAEQLPKSLPPIALAPIFRERVWGRRSLSPFFPDVGAETDTGLIGEAWFSFEENYTSFGITLGQLLGSNPELLGSAGDPKHPGICPLLIKLIFTTEKLSVQVHPDDAYAEQHHNSLGKTEAWYVIAAEPDAEVAAGFREQVTSERLKQAAQTGEIERLVAWHKVRAGDVVFVPAGTVHAIGAGLTICEVQENSDITYRLYDYGRPRELHLEHGAAVSDLRPYSLKPVKRQIAEGRQELIECPYFRMERLSPKSTIQVEAGLPHYLLLICVRGEGRIANARFRPGTAWFIPARGEQFAIEGAGSDWILTYTADEALSKIHL